MVETSNERTCLWTGQWMAGADGACVPVIVDVPTDRHVNSGRGTAHYLAKGFRPVGEIPADGPADALRLSRGGLPDVAAYLAAMDPPEEEPSCSPPTE